MALLNVLQECDLSNAADVAAKLIEEEVGWSDITGAYLGTHVVGTLVCTISSATLQKVECGRKLSSTSTKLAPKTTTGASKKKRKARRG